MQFRPFYFIILSSILLSSCSGRDFGDRTDVITPDGSAEVSIMDFSDPPALDPMTPGWFHRTFFWHGPMDIEFLEKDNRAAVKLSTDDSASMLIRHVDIDLEAYPLLSWQWFIEQPIRSDTDEQTSNGDDHPARFFIIFETASKERRAIEIIWGNRMAGGDYKYIGSFPHYVARGGDKNVGAWHDETINLLDIYRTTWSDRASVKVTIIGLFCDSDDTDTRSIAYFADVHMKRTE